MTLKTWKKTPTKVAHNRPLMFFSVLPKTVWSAQAVANPYSFFNVSYTWYKSLVEGNLKEKVLLLLRGKTAVLPVLPMMVPLLSKLKRIRLLSWPFHENDKNCLKQQRTHTLLARRTFSETTRRQVKCVSNSAVGELTQNAWYITPYNVYLSY